MQHKNLIQIKWADGYRGSDIERIRYRLEDKEKFYALYQQEVDAEFLPKQEKIRLYQEFLRNQLAQVKKLWIRAYYQDLLERSENKRKKDLLELLADEKKYAPCFEGLDQLTESVFKRIFSKKYLGNTKTFEQEMQSHVISTAKKFCPDVEKEMDDTTVLQQLWIEEYAQELSLKGKLHFCLKEENGSTQEINTECYRFGTTLNSQTLEHAEIKEVQNIQKIVIFENKANYISAPYKDGILYLFSHGYFSPKECRFLVQEFPFLFIE